MSKNPFWQGETYAIIKAMKATGNQPGVVQRWKDAMVQMATNPSPEFEPMRAWLPFWQVRPFYTARELAPLWPALALALGVEKTPGKMSAAIGPARLAQELIFGGLPQLDWGRWFLNPMNGTHENYFIVERIHYWARRDVSNEEFLEAYHAHR